MRCHEDKTRRTGRSIKGTEPTIHPSTQGNIDTFPQKKRNSQHFKVHSTGITQQAMSERVLVTILSPHDDRNPVHGPHINDFSHNDLDASESSLKSPVDEEAFLHGSVAVARRKRRMSESGGGYEDSESER